MIIESSSVNELYQEACKELFYNPEHTSYSSKGKYLKECIETKLILTNPRDRIITIPERKLSLFYLAGEIAFYFSGSPYVKDIAFYSKYWNKISDDGKTVNSNYGRKLLWEQVEGISQFEYAKYQLLKNKDSKKAVMIIYTRENTNISTKDNPCTMYLHFFIRNNKLDLHAYMRSNDILFGITYDIPFFTIIQEAMYVPLKSKYEELELGKYTHNSGSLHVYDYHYDKVKSIADSEDSCDSMKMPLITYQTFEEMNQFIKIEKKIRTTNWLKNHDLNDSKITDNFLLCLLEWIVSGILEKELKK